MTRRSLLFTSSFAALASVAAAQDDDGLTRLTIHVTTEAGRPVDRASVVVKFKSGRSVRKFGKNVRLSWELRTDQDGQAKIPPIPQGDILVQVIAKGYQTYGDTLTIEESERTVDVKLAKPAKQFSAHE